MAKKCSRCGEHKPETEFYSCPISPSGVRNPCKACVRTCVKKRRDDNIEQFRAKDRLWALMPHRRRKNRRGHDTPSEKTRKYRSKHPERDRVKQKVRYAVKVGKIVPTPCERCGSTNVQAHHEDYSKPLGVTWLCPFHHGERHREINEMRRAAA